MGGLMIAVRDVCMTLYATPDIVLEGVALRLVILARLTHLVLPTSAEILVAIPVNDRLGSPIVSASRGQAFRHSACVPIFVNLMNPVEEAAAGAEAGRRPHPLPSPVRVIPPRPLFPSAGPL